jgi:predicted DsbA family dithiol-disulfide isomerase
MPARPQPGPNRRILRVDIVADTICPWCYLGMRRLDQALSMVPDIAAERRWRVFLLNPDMPEEGAERAAYLLRKFGSAERTREVLDHLVESGRRAGIPFRFEHIARVPNSLNSHRFIRWAASAGRQDEAIEAIFRFYFEEGLDIGEESVLCDAATVIGLDPRAARRYLASAEARRELLIEDWEFKRLGLQGVPCFILGGKYVISGAQAPEAFLPVVDLLRQERA